MSLGVRVLWVMLLASCGGAERPGLLERWVRLGADPHAEASAVVGGLEAGGYRTTQRLEGEELVALAFAREDGRRAVRVLTRIGVAVALDSHGTRGVQVRHGSVRLVDLGVDGHDVDGDGRPEIVIARDGPEGTCIAVVRIAEDGRAQEAPIEVERVVPGECASGLEDVDGDGRFEAIVEVAWPALALSEDEVPRLRIALVAEGGGWRAGAMPLPYDERERQARRMALSAARARYDVAASSRLGVELAALANLAGAPLAAQVGRYDEALAGLVLREQERDAIDAVRAHIGAGWGARMPDRRATTPPSAR